MKKFLSRIAVMWLAVFFLSASFAVAAESADVSAITAPLNKIYDLVKAVISVVAVLAITFAGAKFMFSGDNIQAREGAKSMLGYAIAGLVIIWIAPLLVNFLTAPA